MTLGVESREPFETDQQLIKGKASPSAFSSGWKLSSLDKLAIFLKGFGIPKSDIDPSQEHPCVHYGELFTTYGVSISKVVSRTNAINAAILAQPNDVLMPTSDVTPTGLATASAIEDSGIAIGGDVLIIRPNSNLLLGAFLANVIRFHRKQILSLVTGSTVYHIYASEMKKFVFLLPSVEEQQAIAQVLSDSDLLLESLDKLITKKRYIKQGVSQQLLTGRMRLQRFRGEEAGLNVIQDDWQLVAIKDILRRVKGLPKSVSSSEILQFGSVPVVDQGKSLIAGYTNNTDFEVDCPPEGLLVFGDHTRVIKYIDFNFATGADGTQVLEARMPLNIRFVTYAIQNQEIPNTGYNRHYKYLAELEILLPGLEEQNAIAEVLSTLDAEIDTLVKQKDKTSLIKIGLMQDLLTGKVRL